LCSLGNNFRLGYNALFGGSFWLSNFLGLFSRLGIREGSAKFFGNRGCDCGRSALDVFAELF
jgi:hypothetical protein